MMTPELAFDAIKDAASISVDVAAISCIKQMKDSGYGKDEVEESMSEILSMISHDIPEAMRLISEHCLLIAESEDVGNMSVHAAKSSMTATAFAEFAHVGFRVAERIVSRNAKGGAE